jgi:FK506-binding protein 4/5
VIDGLDLAVMKMKKGEQAEVIISPVYAFKGEASKQPLAVVPPLSTVIYTLTLVDFQNVRR